MSGCDLYTHRRLAALMRETTRLKRENARLRAALTEFQLHEEQAAKIAPFLDHAYDLAALARQRGEGEKG